MNYTIRSPSKEDYSLVEKIHRDFTGELIDSEQLNTFRRYIYFQSDLIKIALKSKEIVGYAFGYHENPRKAVIYTLYVKPQYQKNGIGTILLTNIEQTLRSRSSILEYMSIRIPKKYESSLKFFQKFNFTKIASINYYIKKDLSFIEKKNPKIKIRPIKMTNHDYQALQELDTTCFPKYWQITKEEFKNLKESEESSIFLAFIDNRLVGYNYNTVSKTSQEGHYVRIATHPEYRKKGVATSLTVEAFNYFKKMRVKSVLLSTYADSKIHNQIYQKWGFKIIGQDIVLAKSF